MLPTQESVQEVESIFHSFLFIHNTKQISEEDVPTPSALSLLG